MKERIRIAIVGSAGRMGCMLVKLVMNSEDMELAGAVDMEGHPSLGQDAGLLAEAGEAGVMLTSDISAIADADLFIDFSLHEGVPAHAAAVAAMGKVLVIGSTGVNDEEAEAVRKAAETIPVVWAPNMSLGVNLLFAMVKKAGEILKDGYTAVVEETHHIHKKDAPSGTALRLGERLAEGRGVDFDAVMTHVEGDAEAESAPDGILMRSHREGEVVGDHTVSFENDAERIEFTHHAHSREVFALGALHAARWVADKPVGLYDMQDVLNLR